MKVKCLKNNKPSDEVYFIHSFMVNPSEKKSKVADCIGNEDTDDGDFRDKGTNSCYTDKVFVFDTIIESQHLNSDNTVKVGYLKIKEKIAELQESNSEVKFINGDET